MRARSKNTQERCSNAKHQTSVIAHLNEPQTKYERSNRSGKKRATGQVSLSIRSLVKPGQLGFWIVFKSLPHNQIIQNSGDRKLQILPFRLISGKKNERHQSQDAVRN